MTAVVTVTVNPALDQTLWIPGFAAARVNRVEREVVRPGGKGVNVAARLAELGVSVAATGLLGNDNAAPFVALMADRGIEDGFVRQPGATRIGVKIVDPVGDRTTDINFPGEPPDARSLVDLEDRVSALAGGASWIVLAGSLPPGVPTDLYRRLIEVAHERGASVALDTSGEALRRAVEARPDLIKPNEHELEDLVGRRLDRPDDVLDAARELADFGLEFAVVSMGAQGALFCRRDLLVHAAPLQVPVASTVGAGDAMVAGVIAARLGHLPLHAVAAFATACSASAISAVDARLDRGAVETLATTVHVTPMPVVAPAGSRTGIQGES